MYAGTYQQNQGFNQQQNYQQGPPNQQTPSGQGSSSSNDLTKLAFSVFIVRREHIYETNSSHTQQSLTIFVFSKTLTGFENQTLLNHFSGIEIVAKAHGLPKKSLHIFIFKQMWQRTVACHRASDWKTHFSGLGAEIRSFLSLFVNPWKTSFPVRFRNKKSLHVSDGFETRK